MQVVKPLYFDMFVDGTFASTFREDNTIFKTKKSIEICAMVTPVANKQVKSKGMVTCGQTCVVRQSKIEDRLRAKFVFSKPAN